MKKESKKTRVDDLILDVLEYAFTEWLVRRGIFVAFKTNYDVVVTPYGGFRDRLRTHVRRFLRRPGLDPSYLISTAFPFSTTPEGADFWREQSVAWELFYSRLQSKL